MPCAGATQPSSQPCQADTSAGATQPFDNDPMYCTDVCNPDPSIFSGASSDCSSSVQPPAYTDECSVVTFSDLSAIGIYHRCNGEVFYGQDAFIDDDTSSSSYSLDLDSWVPREACSTLVHPCSSQDTQNT